MFRNREAVRRRLQEIIERFRQKGATSPEKAMTLEELDLPPRFEEAMHRRLGQSGIFVEVNGKYYLNEERLRQIQEQRAKTGAGRNGSGSWSQTGGPPTWSRIVAILLMLPIGLIIAFALIYLATPTGGYFHGELLIILIVILLVLAVVRLLLWRSRRKYWQNY